MGEKKGSGSRALKTVQIAVDFTILSVQCNRMRMQDLKPDGLHWTSGHSTL